MNFRPFDPEGCTKKRYGQDGDGGYVIIDDSYSGIRMFHSKIN